MQGKRICFVGAGNMGEALIGGIISGRVASSENITVHEIRKEQQQQLKTTHKVNISEDLNKSIRESDIIMVAVKPQNIEEVLRDIAGDITNQLVISIAAGITTGFIEKILGERTHVIRVMPNTPALIGEGATALARGSKTEENDIATARLIFDSVGTTVVVGEGLIDAVTGLSGSGPAYGFIIIEALADAGVKQGLSQEIALKLAAQTMLGAAKLCLKGDRTPAQLTAMVTSPGGTTIEGIKALDKGMIRETLSQAVDAATKRSKELGKKG